MNSSFICYVFLSSNSCKANHVSKVEEGPEWMRPTLETPTTEKEKICIISTAKTAEDGYAIWASVTKADFERPWLWLFDPTRFVRFHLYHPSFSCEGVDSVQACCLVRQICPAKLNSLKLPRYQESVRE